VASDFKMSRSKVPCSREVGSGFKRGLLSEFYRMVIFNL
jgi:hypothetical protein